MAATPGDVPAWLQDDHSEVEGEDVSLGPSGSSARQFHDYTQPPRRSRCRRCAVPVAICLALAGLAAGLAVYFTGKSPAELAEDTYEGVEDLVTGGGGDDEEEKEPYSDEPTEFVFYSDAFDDGDELPSKYTEAGEGESPPLMWKNLPEGTESLALFFDEPSDNGTTTFWVAYDIPVAADGIPEGMPNAERVELTRADTDEGNGGSDIFMLQGLNSWGAQLYDGDDGADAKGAVGAFGYRPPDMDDGDAAKGEVRICYFRLLALKEQLDGSLDPSFATADEVRREAKEVGILSELTIQVTFTEEE